MEYHFTGTGGSPDFTFIADGIIDGTGKFIFYTAIKNIKVTRKGGKAALIITTAESNIKEQCVYLVQELNHQENYLCDGSGCNFSRWLSGMVY